MTPHEHLGDALATSADESSSEAVRSRAAQVLRPPGAMAVLDNLAAWLAGWQRTEKPSINAAGVAVFAADHGVAARGVSAFPSEITKAMVAAIESGQATCTALARQVGASVELVDVGVGDPTADFTVSDALSTDRFSKAWQTGISTVADLHERDGGIDLLIPGELGIGNTTAASAVAAAVIGGEPGEWCGRGTGVDDAGLSRKIETVTEGLQRIDGEQDPLEKLRRVGGAELVAIAGATVEARRRSIPVLLDGFIATAALAPLHAIDPTILDHCVAGHASAEPGHQKLLDYLGKQPLLSLDLRLGEASGALVALPLLRAAATAVVDVATFAEAGITDAPNDGDTD